ncbi:MAG: peptidoglycan editing factor PgeF [Deltaproteobacteria bacterium]|nr:peptidoglycan editing factor PgeF [Deltaproteobacteria bacterium]
MLVSPALTVPGVRHAFSTRRGGVSPAPCDSLSFGLAAGNPEAAWRTNAERLAARVGLGAEALHCARQVHGTRVLEVPAGADPAATRAESADALVTARPGTMVGVFTADCVPVLLADAEAGVVAAVHAGWRGLSAGVIEAAANRMVVRHGARPERLRAAIGPCIGPCCYEVGPEVVEAFAALPRAVRSGGAGRPHVDLAVGAEEVLLRLGVLPAHLGRAELCTRCLPELFFSYRRDGERAGRQLSVVALCGPA